MSNHDDMQTDWGQPWQCRDSDLLPEYQAGQLGATPMPTGRVLTQQVLAEVSTPYALLPILPVVPVLPDDSEARKNIPLVTGVLDYFPDALAAVARLSKIGNDKHNPGQPLHWSRDKSTDHADCIGRHLLDRTKRDTDGEGHWVHLAWRALAFCQLMEEKAAKT